MPSSRVPYIANVLPNDWNSVLRFSRDVQKYMSTLANSEQTLYTTELFITGSTASRLLATDAAREVVSTDLASWVTGTANQIIVTDDTDGTITLSTPQDLDTAADFQVQSLLVDQNTDAIGINIDSEATTATNYGLQVVTGAGAGAGYFSYGAADNGACWLGLGNNSAYSANFFFSRNLTAASTDSPVVSMVQDHASDDQPTLYLKNDGSGDALYVAAGSISIAAGVTVSTGVTVPDLGYIGSVSTPTAIQIEGDGDLVLIGGIDVPNDIICGGHVIFDLDNGHIGYTDNSPMLTFNNADDRTEVTGGLNFTALTASRLTATDANKTLASTDLNSWVAGTANQIIVTDDADGTITLSTSQDIAAASSPTFTGLTLSGLTQGSIPFAGVSGVISQDNANFFWDAGTLKFNVGPRAGLAAFNSMFTVSGNGNYSGYSAFSDTAGHEPVFYLIRSRGTNAVPAAVLSGDSLGSVRFVGQYSATPGQVNSVAAISGLATENYSSGNNGAKIEISTIPNGSATRVTRITVDQDGTTSIGDGGTTNYLGISATGDVSFTGSSGFYPRRVSQNTEPANGTGATQIDAGELMIWHDADGEETWLMYNDATSGIVGIKLE